MFSSTVMPVNSRMFWKVRATLAVRAISWSGMRSSRYRSPEAPRMCFLPERVRASTSSGAAMPWRASAMRPSVGL